MAFSLECHGRTETCNAGAYDYDVQIQHRSTYKAERNMFDVLLFPGPQLTLPVRNALRYRG